MIFNPDSLQPIYVQIAEWVEAEILSGNLPEEERVYSQYQLAGMFNINPATAARGLNILADEGIVYKKRGLGMYVAPRAKQHILKKRKSRRLRPMIKELLKESGRLKVDFNELLEMLEEAREESGREERE